MVLRETHTGAEMLRRSVVMWLGMHDLNHSFLLLNSGFFFFCASGPAQKAGRARAVFRGSLYDLFFFQFVFHPPGDYTAQWGCFRNIENANIRGHCPEIPKTEPPLAKGKLPGFHPGLRPSVDVDTGSGDVYYNPLD
jgi:hypothetical protein